MFNKLREFLRAQDEKLEILQCIYDPQYSDAAIIKIVWDLKKSIDCNDWGACDRFNNIRKKALKTRPALNGHLPDPLPLLI